MFIFSFKQLTKHLQHTQGEVEKVSLSQKERELALHISESIQRISPYTPFKTACLLQALTAQQMLQNRNISGMFYLGVAKESKIQAHAWSKCYDIFITGEIGHQNFKIISIFSW